MPGTPRRATAKPLFETLVPQPAYGRVAAAIEQKILGRSLRPGDALPTETELAGQFGVNRSTVREALRRLESAGLVGREGGSKRLRVTRPGRAETASRVSRALALDDVTFIELWEAMLAIAPRTAALAATRAGSPELASLEAAIAAVERARGSEAAVQGVVQFFDGLAQASGNRVLMLAMRPVTGLLSPSLRRMIDRTPQGRTRIVVAQRCILEALRKGDAAEAESWMTRHVQDFRRGYEVAGISLDTRVVGS
ncbi:MAG: FadR family transcriptional regulator [Lysobacterales bacterium]|jgi:DNA-binding FadR family transcriptional regulator|nr:MAG: FadR family transcriptional regulator [Xanthomonadales bacterium]